MFDLDERGLLGNTLIVLTADHGEAMGEDGFYFSHGHSVGLDQVRVPLIMTGPGCPKGLVVETPVSNVSVAACILEAIGLEKPEGIQTNPLVGAGEIRESPENPFFFETFNQSGVVVSDTYLRRDRRPASDSSFWDKPNPNSKGYWKPLGTEAKRLLDSGGSVPGHPNTEEASVILSDFDARAADARASIATTRVPAGKPAHILEQLRALGYVH
jgi:hypothetical protein